MMSWKELKNSALRKFQQTLSNHAGFTSTSTLPPPAPSYNGQDGYASQCAQLDQQYWTQYNHALSQYGRTPAMTQYETQLNTWYSNEKARLHAAQQQQLQPVMQSQAVMQSQPTAAPSQFPSYYGHHEKFSNNNNSVQSAANGLQKQNGIWSHIYGSNTGETSFIPQFEKIMNDAKQMEDAAMKNMYESTLQWQKDSANRIYGKDTNFAADDSYNKLMEGLPFFGTEGWEKHLNSTGSPYFMNETEYVWQRNKEYVGMSRYMRMQNVQSQLVPKSWSLERLNTLERDTPDHRPITESLFKGVSIILDLKKGISELYKLKHAVDRNRRSDVKDSSLDEAVLDDVPIFVVSYRHCSFDGEWRMSDGQMKELYEILCTITASSQRRVRLWCDRLLEGGDSITWEGVGLLPYTVLPVVSIGCSDTFSGEASDDRLWMEVERHMGVICAGLVYREGSLRSLKQGAFKLRTFYEFKGVRDLLRVQGEQESINMALLRYANGMLDGIYTTATSSTYDLVGSMEKMAWKLLKGTPVREILEVEENESEVLYDLGGVNTGEVLQGMCYGARLLGEDTVSLDRVTDEESSLGWDGISEFVRDVPLGEKLGVHTLPRRYFVVCSADEELMHVLCVTEVGNGMRLYGALSVMRDGDHAEYGRVVARISNIEGGIHPGLEAEILKTGFIHPLKAALEGIDMLDDIDWERIRMEHMNECLNPENPGKWGNYTAQELDVSEIR